MTLEEYIRGIPVEIRRAISGFDNDIRLGIFLALMKHRELSFSDLSKKLGMESDKAKFNFHLRKLTESALIEHYYRHQLGNEKFSFYSTTKFGQKLWSNIVHSLKPPSPIVDIGESSGKYSTETLKGRGELSDLALSDNPTILITAPSKTHKRKIPKKYSDQVNYKDAKV